LLEALAFAPEERSLNVFSLADNLQNEGMPEDEVAKAWLAEARKRSDDMTSGRAIAIPLEEFRSWVSGL
jgi:Putative addiction module component